MKILDNIELIDLAIYTNKTLIVTDFHIGYEESLNKQGLMIPRFQFAEIMNRLESIFNKLKNKDLERIIVNGDLKHEFGTISDQEWRNTLKLIDYFGQHCNEIILIKGNHDTILGPIAKKRNVKVLGHYLINILDNNSMKKISIDNKSQLKIKKNNINEKIKKSLKIIKNNKKLSKNKILIIHGDNIPDKKALKDVSTIIIGHEHPAVSIKDGPRIELFKSFLVGKWKNHNLIAQPSFNLVTEGTDILKEQILSPFLKGNLMNFNAVVVSDKLYKFGKLKDLR